jgi:hypothetical protein
VSDDDILETNYPASRRKGCKRDYIVKNIM